jgi:hypothetical protein
MLDGVVGQPHALAALPPGKRPGTHCIKISPPTGIRSPEYPFRSESLYRLSYPGPQSHVISRKRLAENFNEAVWAQIARHAVESLIQEPL